MQTGEGLYRRWRLTRAIGVAAAFAALLAADGPSRAQGRWSDPAFMDPPGCPAGARGPGRGYARATLLAASPYGIEDLSAWRAEIRVGTSRIATGIFWRLLAHPLYREDLVAGLVECRLPFVDVSCGVAPVLSTRAVEGFGAERSFVLLAAVAWSPARFASIRATIPTRRGGWEEGPGPSLIARVGAGGMRAGVLAHSPDRIVMETRVFAAMDLGGGASIESAYAVRAREVSGAFALERKEFLVSFAWSVHPDLGVCSSVEVGRGWSW